METIKNLKQLNKLDFSLMAENEFWNKGEEKEISIHKVHVYPAKFPSLIAQKSFEYAQKHRMKVARVADIFCGCGTVAVEAKRQGYDFWGCDLNPVAVLLSKVKTTIYDSDKVRKFGEDIIKLFETGEIKNNYKYANERLQYWFTESQYNKLYTLKEIIDNYNYDNSYHELFLCIFSSILKSTSKWLTKSIKPQVDPNKTETDVIGSFQKQLNVFIHAIETENYSESTIEIECKNVLEIDKENYVDLIISSPPYVTSYEYADLHQLSSLWLGYTDDYKELRKDSIGSQYNTQTLNIDALVPTAKKIVDQLNPGAKLNAISRYYLQMDKVIDKCFELLKNNGLCIFVIGDTEYKKIKIENAKCLCESLINRGFEITEISKRRIENKFLPSHRDEIGRFSSSKDDRKIYSQEYIIIGRKK